jgi:hypothetical protein
MNRFLLTATALATIAGGGYALAQSATPNADDHAAHHPAKTTTVVPPVGPAGAGQAAMGGGAMAGGMGSGMMGMMGGGMCPMMGAGATKVDVKKIDKGVTITMTSSDGATATRLQKMAEAMRLMHEAMGQ